MKNIDSDLIRGNIDTIILKTMLDGDKYGLDIIKEVETKSNGTYNLKQPTLYSCLKRLENQELISSYWLDSDIGGKRHYYKLTEKGREFYKQKQEEWSMSKFIIDNLLSNYNNDEYRLVKKDDYDKIIDGKTFEYDENASKQSQSENVTSIDEVEDADVETKSDEEAELSGEYELNETETTDDESDDDFGIDEYENLLSSEDESDEDETEETDIEESESFEETEDDYPVYFNLGDDNLEVKAENTMEEENKSESENNLLARLRQQQNEEINTYYGDKNSYINHLNVNEDENEDSQEEVVAVQQNLLDGENQNAEDEFLNKVNKFTEAAQNWQNFNSEGETTETEDEFIIPELKETEIANLEEDEEISDETFDDTNDITIENFNLMNEDESEVEEIEQFEEYTENNDVAQTEIEDDFFDDLDKLNNLSKSTFIKSDDGTEYDKTEVDEKIENFTQSETYEENNNVTDELNEEVSDYDNNFDNSEVVETETNNNYNSNDFSEFDNIISHNADTYSQATMFSDSYSNPLFEPIQQQMTVVTETNTVQTKEPSTSAKNIETLKTDFAKQGIIIKEYKKSSPSEETKNYLLANKINMICSLILLCCYVFVLSATYVILNYTKLGSMNGFSFLPFLYGIIPFAIWTIYHTVRYFISPYKKVPAKYSPLVTLFISLIITVQLLLITYCFNLQLGFYSFSQASYNHLLWIIPMIISVAPIASNLIYIGLFYSQNFNV